MKDSSFQGLLDALTEVPVLDIHTHLVGGKMGAQGLHDILLYHMVISDLYAAGCPQGARLTQFPQWPTRDEAHQRIQQALPFLPFIQNTSSWWAVRIILRDLYDWTQTITSDNWTQLDDQIREHANDPAWPRQVLHRLNIQRSGTELARRGQGEDDDRLQYALEWGFFTRTQWGEFDTALFELERCWGKSPQSPSPIGGHPRPQTDRTIHSLNDVHEAVRHYVDAIPYDQVLATATHISTDIKFQDVSAAQMEDALQRRAKAGASERDIYASYVQELFLTELEKHGSDIVYQFSLGAEPLPFETGSRLRQKTLSYLSQMMERHPKLRFQCLLANRHGNQSLCTLARELPNLSLAGFWWHNFFPDTIRQVMTERLDMLPTNRQVGFFSDAYCVEWTHAKLVMVRRQLAEVLAAKINQGQYTKEEAMTVARAILYDSPQSLLNMKPK